MTNQVFINFDYLKKNLEKVGKQNFNLFVGWNNPGMANIAKLHEYGGTSPTPKFWIKHIKQKFGIDIPDTLQIPPRPHRYKTMQKFKDEWTQTFGKLLMQNNYNIEKSFKQLGAIIRQDYYTVLMSGEFTSLWWVTIEMRHVKDISGTAPLVATGQMQRQLTYEVFRV